VEEDEEFDYMPTKRYAYSREQKLAAIDYFQSTWKEKQDGTYKRLSNRYASKKLKITCKMLRHWVTNKEAIQSQKKGSFRGKYSHPRTQEPVIEQRLNNDFKEAREKGRKISYKWIIRYTRQIYTELHPNRIIHYKYGKKTYLGFRFSSG
jgi:hypothetical protein